MFEELATRAHDMELSIASHGGKKEPAMEHRKDRVFGQKVEKPVKKPTKEAMTVNTASVKISTRDKKKEVRKMKPSQQVDRRQRTLKELEEKTYPFPDSDVASMLEDLLEKKVIELPECKRPEEMNRVNDPKFCKYHRIVSHPVEKCFVLKELIMNLARQGRIELDVDEVETPTSPQSCLDLSIQCHCSHHHQNWSFSRQGANTEWLIHVQKKW